MTKSLIVEKRFEKERLDKFLQYNLKSISRNKIYHLIKEGKIKVNGELKKPSYRLKYKDKILVEIEKIKNNLEPFNLEVEIIYEDDNIIVVNKPSGLTVHPSSPGCHKTLVNALIYMKKKLSKINLLRPGIVHRLDKETSGVMVVAKDGFSYLNLVKQFQKREVKKEYRAICWGKVKKDELVVDLPLARDRKNPLKMKISFLRSKDAYTKLKIIKILKDSTFLSIFPYTGRMHQIRIHLQFLGYPIVGDKKYGIKDGYKEMFLHAYKLGFYHPRKNEFMEFVSPIPDKFNKFIEERCI
jgi:23S rRNA pseudouridine1911/1915/1917 synthase